MIALVEQISLIWVFCQLVKGQGRNDWECENSLRLITLISFDQHPLYFGPFYIIERLSFPDR